MILSQSSRTHSLHLLTLTFFYYNSWAPNYLWRALSREGQDPWHIPWVQSLADCVRLSSIAYSSSHAISPPYQSLSSVTQDQSNQWKHFQTSCLILLIPILLLHCHSSDWTLLCDWTPAFASFKLSDHRSDAYEQDSFSVWCSDEVYVLCSHRRRLLNPCLFA